jgi:hypothetical protein
MSCRREPRVGLFSSSPTGRAAPFPVTQGRSATSRVAAPGARVVVGKDTACAAGTLVYVGIGGLIPGASKAHACGHPDVHRAHLVPHRPVADRDGDLAGTHCGGREHSGTHKTCSTAGPLCIIHYPLPLYPARGFSELCLSSHILHVLRSSKAGLST